MRVLEGIIYNFWANKSLIVVSRSGDVVEILLRAKTAAARAAVEIVVTLRDGGLIVGLGSGSTAELFVKELASSSSASSSSKKLAMTVVPTSKRTGALAASLGITNTKNPNELENGIIDIAVDGADQVDPEFNLVKGFGGALFLEKLVARLAREFVIIVDERKLVKKLGPTLPVEIVPVALKSVTRHLERLGARNCKLRTRTATTTTTTTGDGAPFVTDTGNLIVDADFDSVNADLARRIKQVTGVLETGFFDGELVNLVIVGKCDGTVEVLERKK